MRIDLAEWETARDLDLSPGLVQQLARTSTFEVRPDTNASGNWMLSATHHVGVARIGDLEVRVRPKIRPDRLVELLISSLNRIAWDHERFDWGKSDDLVSTITGAFLATAERALSAGILQGYVSEEADLYGVRGRIDLSRQLSRNHGLPLPIAVSYDEYTTNIVENQLLKGAGQLLLRLPGLPSALQVRLRRLEYQLLDVTPTRPSPTPPKVQWSRLNLRYRPAVALAQLILKQGVLDFEGSSSISAPAFMVDMNQVFEDVVGHGLSKVLTPELTVDLQRGEYLDCDRRIPIRPDIVVRKGSEVVAVADAKYKRVGKQGVSTKDVFQALAYATRYGLAECTLIYPEQPALDRVQVRDVTIQLAAVDINGPRSERIMSIGALAEALRNSSARHPAPS